MNPVDKMLIEYAKLHVQLVLANETIQKLLAENAALQAQIKATDVPTTDASARK